MGIEKIGASIGKEIIAWTRTGKSLLTTKPIKINPSGLKYVPLEHDLLEIPKLNFSKYKSKIISYLKMDSPREYMIIADRETGKTIFSHLGNATECGGNIDYKKLPLNSKTSVLLHGHPTYYTDGVLTTPLSEPDFRSFVRLPMNEVVAYNELGQYSRMRKTDKFQQLKTEDIKSIIDELYKRLETLIPKNKLEECSSGFAFKFFKKFGLIEEQMTTQEGIKLMDKYWREICPKIGIEYHCNYSGL